MATKEKEVFYHIDLPPEKGGTITFYSEEEAKTWIAEEYNFWSWVENSSQRTNSPLRQEVIGTFVNVFFNRLRDLYNSSISTNNIEKSQLDYILTNVLNQSNYFLSNTINAEIIIKIRDKYGYDEAIAAIAIATDIASNVQYLRSNEILGISVYNLIKNGTSEDGLEVLKSSFQKAQQSATAKFAKLNKSVQDDLSTLEDKIKLADTTIEETKSWFKSETEEYNRSLKNKLKQEIDILHSEIEALHTVKRTYEEHMKLKAPVQYWRQKKEEHEKNIIKQKNALLWYTGIVLVLYLLIICLSWKHIINPKEFDYLPLAMFAFITTVVFWAGRILVRLYLSEKHLQIDAEERAVMVETYLALTMDEKIDKEDRSLVLAPLFKPTSDGIVKDDAAPNLMPSSYYSHSR